MAVLSAQYKHPQSAYSQGLRNLIDSMLNALVPGGLFLTETKYSFIQTLNMGLPAQVEISVEKSLPWEEIKNWPITINVCIFV